MQYNVILIYNDINIIFYINDNVASAWKILIMYIIKYINVVAVAEINK